MTKEEALNALGVAYYGAGFNSAEASPILEMLLQLFAGIIKDCGAQRAHDMVNGRLLQRAAARRRLLWDAYSMTGDWQEANRMADIGMEVGKKHTREQFSAVAAL